MNIQNLILHADSKTSSAGRVFKNGSPVFVRIISDKGNGKYEASVGGVKIELSSAKSQKPGTSFVGNISILNGKIQINQPENNALNSAVRLESFEYEAVLDLFAKIGNESVAAFFNSMGIIPDNLSYLIFNQLKLLELKIDASLINKIHNLAKKFKGKEKLAADILTNFYKKGIEISEEELKVLLNQMDLSMDNSFPDSTNGNSQEKQDENKDKEKNYDILKVGARNIVNNFCKNIFGGNINNRIGPLTISNHILSKNKSGGSWFSFPFELVDGLNLNFNILGKGVLHLFIEGNRQLSAMNMNCIYKGKKYLFSISIANKIIRQIKMNVSPSSESQKNSYFKNFCEAFIKNFPKAECIWCEKDELEGFGSSDEKIFFVEGEV